VDAIYEIISGYAEDGIMLPRSKPALTRAIHQFVVAELDGKVIGCGSLFRLGPDLIEIRSLGIMKGYQGHGIGSQLVKRLLLLARELGIPKVMALTLEDSFFVKNGFDVVEKSIFPEKVWTDCIYCKKQHCCDEIAVLKLI
jgi:amino-acid N-acetyltransferase